MILDNAEMNQIVDVTSSARKLTMGETTILYVLASVHPEHVSSKAVAQRAMSTQGSVRVLKWQANKKLAGTGLRIASKEHHGYWLEYDPAP